MFSDLQIRRKFVYFRFPILRMSSKKVDLSIGRVLDRLAYVPVAIISLQTLAVLTSRDSLDNNQVLSAKISG